MVPRLYHELPKKVAESGIFLRFLRKPENLLPAAPDFELLILFNPDEKEICFTLPAGAPNSCCVDKNNSDQMFCSEKLYFKDSKAR